MEDNMAIIHSYFLRYLTDILSNSLTNETPAFYYDPLLLLAEYCIETDTKETRERVKMDFLIHSSFSDSIIKKARNAYSRYGVIGIFRSYFEKGIVNQFVNTNIERKIIALKKGFTNLPATKASIILKGFGHELEKEDVLSVYASHGFAQGMKGLTNYFNFMSLNRRIDRLALLTKQDPDSVDVKKVQTRYLAMRKYLVATKGGREKAIRSSGLSRSLFFFYWKRFNTYSLLGLIDKGKEVFRESKMGLGNEAKIVIDKIQNPNRQEAFYVEQLKTKGIRIDRSSIAKIFSRWEISVYESKFVSNLKRLESIDEISKDEEGREEKEEVKRNEDIDRYVDNNFIKLLKGIRKNGIYVDGPGIFILWAYIEELGIYPALDSMGLTRSNNGKGYSWFDHFLLNISRVFYGISSFSRACEHEEPTLSLFSHLVSLPCNDSFLNGLGSITENQVFELQKWLVNRIKDLGLSQGKRLAFDFKQIDLDVELDKLRQFGKGPSPKKKICYNGFRPHIAWDVDTGNIVVMEFRKGSARGTTTVKRFIKDFILAGYKDFCEEIYIDSEYTGTGVWNFLLDKENGMGAQITACLKQNAFVKKHRNNFLLENINEENFWVYYDDDHVYSSKTFILSWENKHMENHEKKSYKLYCVVKKNIKNGTLRCFGTSKEGLTSYEILKDYSHRWIIENGIKDLILSYFLDNCPGTDPHQVNVHFFMVSICRHLYWMIQRDLVNYAKNHDGSFKSLATMRDVLFRQGSAKLYLKQETFEIKYLNNNTQKMTVQLNKLYQKIHEKTSNGLKILGGLKIKYLLNPPTGEEHRNCMKKVPLSDVKSFPPEAKIN